MKVATGSLAVVACFCACSEPPAAVTPTKTAGPKIVPVQAGPDDGVEIDGLKGTLTGGQINLGMNPYRDELARCLEQGERFVSGRATFRVYVAKDGSVDRVQTVEGDIGSWPVERCVASVTAKMTFGPPDGGATDFSFPIEVAEKRPFGEWPAAQIQAESSKVIESLATCKGAPTQAMITLYVGVRGAVKSLGLASTGAVIKADWAQCVYDASRTWALRDPRGELVKFQFAYPVETNP